MKRKIKRILLTILVLGILFLPIAPYVRNQICLQQFDNQIKHQLPQDTKIIEKVSACGKLNRNGNSIDFLPLSLFIHHFRSIN